MKEAEEILKICLEAGDKAENYTKVKNPQHLKKLIEQAGFLK